MYQPIIREIGAPERDYLDYAFVNDGRLNWIDRGILSWMMLQPTGKQVSIQKLWIEGGGREKEGPSLVTIRKACKTLSCYGYATFQRGVLQLRKGAEP